jgi:phosphoribosylglycinamide formyltransferase-1
MVRVGVLVSGRGTNLQALIDAEARGELGARIVVVISNRAGVPALERARRAGIPAVVLERRAFPSRQAQEEAIVACLRDHQVDLVVLAGYDRILGPTVLAAYPLRIINIHPSLLPAFRGTLQAQRAALEYGVKVSGCTVHFVTEEVDGGPIILQRVVPVYDDDTPETLAARILAEEHRALPEAVRLFAEGRLRVVGRRVVILPAPALAGASGEDRANRST